MSSSPSKEHSKDYGFESNDEYDSHSQLGVDDFTNNDLSARKRVQESSVPEAKRDKPALGKVAQFYKTVSVNCGFFVIAGKEFFPDGTFSNRKGDCIRLTLADDDELLFHFTLTGPIVKELEEHETGTVLNIEFFSWRPPVTKDRQETRYQFIVPARFDKDVTVVEARPDLNELGSRYKVNRSVPFDLATVKVQNADFTAKLISNTVNTVNQETKRDVRSLMFLTSDNKKVQLTCWEDALKAKYANLYVDKIYRVQNAVKSSTESTAFFDASFSVKEKTVVTEVKSVLGKPVPLAFSQLESRDFGATEVFEATLMITKRFPLRNCFVTDGTIQNGYLLQALLQGYNGEPVVGTNFKGVFQVNKDGEKHVLSCCSVKKLAHSKISNSLLDLPSMNI